MKCVDVPCWQEYCIRQLQLNIICEYVRTLSVWDSTSRVYRRFPKNNPVQARTRLAGLIHFQGASVNKKDFYQMHKTCLNSGESAKEDKTDQLLCLKYKGYCSMQKCLNVHNITNKKG